MLTQLGTAAGVAQLRGTMIEGFSSIRGQQSSLQISDDNVVAFMGSTPVVLSKLPPHVTLSEHLVFRSFITLQVGKISTAFKKLASHGSYPTEEPDSLHLQPPTLVFWLPPSTVEETEYVHSHAVSLTVKIQEDLAIRDDNQSSIQRGARAMSDLAVQLHNLGLFEESASIVRCAVDLYRTLAKTNEDVYGPFLALALRGMSMSLVRTGAPVEAYKAIT